MSILRRLSDHRLLLPLTLFGLLLVRLCWINAYPLDSDETQHAHVAWAWTQGLLPYRDVFDNHGPLFSLLQAPVLALVGERADALDWLRLAMQPWYLLALAATWLIGRRLYGSRMALAAMLLVAFYPRFFEVSGQFRTDDMWAALWLAALAVQVGRPPTPARGLLTGLLAGAALCVSQKTTLLLVTALLASVVVTLASRPRWRWRPVLLLSWLLGLVLLPLLFGLWFTAHGALAPALYDLVSYNTAPTGQLVHSTRWLWFFPAALALLGAVVWQCRRATDALTPWRAWLALQSGLFLLLVWFVWPLITRQDFLPLIPPLLLLLTGQVAARLGPTGVAWRRPLLWSLALVVELVWLLACAPPWQDRLDAQRQQLAAVLRYTAPGDSVMDAKGTAIFRPRPYFPVIETMARERLANGLMKDDIADQLAAHHTMMVIEGDLPPAAAAFTLRNYLPLQHRIRMAGLNLACPEASCHFQLAVPGDYTLVDGSHALIARMDGQPPADHWHLAAGPHVLSAVPPGAQLALLWSQAWERGWRPRSTPSGVDVAQR